MNDHDFGSIVFTIFIGLIGGALKTSTPYLLVSLGETLTEKSGRVNLGLEGTLMMGAMAGFGTSYLTQNALLGVLGAAVVGFLMGIVHGIICNRKGVSSIAVGIAIMILGTGLAFFLGKGLVKPVAPHLGALDLGGWSTNPQVKEALKVNVLLIFGIVCVPIIHFVLKNTKFGLLVRMAGENAEAARNRGYSPEKIRLLATGLGGLLAGVGGAFLSLYFPGSWSEGLSSGIGLLSVALVIFARWNPWRCLWASLLFGALGNLSPVLQSIGIQEGYQLFAALPAVAAIIIMIINGGGARMSGRPKELSVHS